tara:strand:+ start:4027 stop:6228 length:2202 start_codon:yes stop_codon:yes gene_type:complete
MAKVGIKNRVLIFLFASTFIQGCFLNSKISTLSQNLPSAESPDSDADPSNPDSPSSSYNLTVEKVYPTNGADFLKFIKGNNGGTDLVSQPDIACDGTEVAAIDSCIHGGDKLKVSLPTINSCDNLTLSDSLGAFSWFCKNNLAPNSGVTFYSVGFQENKGLADIIDFTGLDWKVNSVELKQSGVSIGTSTAEKWWSIQAGRNPIVTLPDSSMSTLTLTSTTAPGTILVVPTNLDTVGVNIDTDQIAIVVKNEATLSFTGTVNNCDGSSAEMAGANYKCLIASGNQKYVWLEGSFSDKSTGNPFGDMIIFLHTAKNFVLNRIQIRKTGTYEAIYTELSQNLLLANIKIQQAWGAYNIFSINNTRYSRFKNIRVSNNTEGGGSYWNLMALTGNSNGNILSHLNLGLTASGHALAVEGSENIISDILISNARTNLYLLGDRNTVHQLTTITANTTDLATLGNSNLLNQILSIEGYTILDVGGDGNILSQMGFLTGEPWTGAINVDASNVKFTNNIIIHDNANAGRCSANAAKTNPGTVTSICGNTGLSDANWVYFASSYLVDFLVGEVPDGVNQTSPSVGAVPFASITDWLNFENFFRIWVPQTPGDTHCLTGNCFINDYRFNSISNPFLNVSNDGSTANSVFVSNATCPAAVHGNKTITSTHTSPVVFLVNALEILDDGVGNDNGLCETGDRCIYSPNIGVYQGQGDYLSNGTCLFQNGTVQNVKMYAYPEIQVN